jgi:hypothetical protein
MTTQTKRGKAIRARNHDRMIARTTPAITRHIHRIRGLLISLNERLNDAEATLEDTASWGLQQDFQDLERQLAYYLANRNHPEIFNQDEDAAVEKVLAYADPQGEAYFQV